ncbi:MAG: hypothetical protein U0929_05510 [Planctomycetaceae bacterium]
MKKSIFWNICVVAVVATIAEGCGRQELVDPNELPTSPVTGTVLVDGKPVGMIRVVANDMSDPPRTISSPSAFTDNEGKFKLRTFREDDGAPDGEYNLTFQYGTMNLIMGRDYKGDKFKGKYSKKDDSKFKLKVEGKPVDMGTIELKTGK